MTRSALTATNRLDMPRAAVHIRPEVLLYILLIMFPVLVSFGGVVLSGDRLLLLFLTIPLTVNLFIGRYGHLLITDILFFMHVFWAIVSLAINNPDRMVMFIGSNSIEFIGGYMMGRAFIRNSDDFLAACKLLAGLTAFTLPLALYETFTGDAILIRLLENLPGVYSTTQVAGDARHGLERVQVFLAHPILYGVFTSIFFSIVFVGFKGILSTAARYGLTLALLVCTMLSLSSGPLLAIVIQCGFILWAWVFRGTQARWFILLCTAVAAYVIIDLLSDRTPFRVFLHYATFNSGTAYWRASIFEYGMANVWNNPIFGIGLNEWVRPIWMGTGSVDNFWLAMAIRYGIPGFLFLAIGFGLALWRAGRRDLNGSQTMWQLRRAWMIAMMGLTFALCTVHIWGPLYSFVFFFFGAGMWFITAQPDEEELTPATEATERYAPPMRRSASVAPQAKSQASAPSSRPSRTADDAPYTRFPIGGNAGHRQPVSTVRTKR